MEPSMEWSMPDTLDLIDRYREKEVLWDTNNTNYKHANERENAWNELAVVFSTTPFQVKRKIKSLLASYRRERVKLYNCGTKAEESSKWFAFERLSFMKEIYTPRKHQSENGAEKGDVDLMAELLDVSLREGGVYMEDEMESEDRTCLPMTTEYKLAESSTANIYTNGGFSRKRKRTEESLQPGYGRYYPLPEFAVRRDELSVYGEHIANELRHLDRTTLCKVKHMINNIIYEAQISSPDVDSSAKFRSQAHSRYPDSRLSSPSSTNPTGMLRTRRETTDDSELDEDGISSVKVEDGHE